MRLLLVGVVLTGLAAGIGKTDTIDYIIESAFEHRHQVIACDALLSLSFAEEASELSLQQSVGFADFLFLAELDTIFRERISFA